MKVRQPLNEVKFKTDAKLTEELYSILKDEVNVKNIRVDESITNEIELDLVLTPELINEGKYRELVRAIQDLRQEFNFSPNDLIDISIKTETSFFDLIKEKLVKDIKTNKLETIDLVDCEIKKEIELDGLKIEIQIKKI